ncbi:MAG: hypothetical protein ACYC21_07680 [Eubacteriales bacterium]
MFADLLLTLSVRFFLFDFVLFKSLRERLKKNRYFFKKLFSCTFCQGFWCGLVISLLKNWAAPFLSSLEFAFIAAIVSFTWTVMVHPFIKQFENNQDLPMT